jgi:hypothetical protein
MENIDQSLIKGSMDDLQKKNLLFLMHSYTKILQKRTKRDLIEIFFS